MADILLAAPMRRDWPAAKTSAATLGALGGVTIALFVAPLVAVARGKGRLEISFNRPPAPIRMMSCGLIGICAAMR